MDSTQCKRATEGPKKTAKGSFDTSIRQSQCKTAQCNNANFFQSNRPLLKRLHAKLQKRNTIGSKTELTPELQTILEALASAIKNPHSLYDYRTCVSIGDVWLHLESKVAGIKDFATTNYKESEILCPSFDLQMRKP
ncbi:MAG: hypothetical protein FJ271_16270 [Planctomycetes bacterium]|nr:hypothetical protein [Planctomycetota bacterium]